MDIVAAPIENYLRALTACKHPVQQKMEALAAERDFPIVGPLVGSLLEVLARSIGAKRILELGSGFGYSAFWFARALGGEGEIIHTDLDDDNRNAAKEFLDEAGFLSMISFAEGDALGVLDRSDGPFDIVFCDIDKIDYPKVPELALSKLRSGGMLVFDNALWSGRVVADDKDADTQAVVELNRMLYGRDDVSNTLLPLRDGVLVSLKH